MEGRFLHLLTLLKIKFSLDHHMDLQKVTHRNRRPLQSSSGPEKKRIHMDPSLCLHLTLTSLVGLSYFHLRRMGRGTELRLPDKLLKLLTRTMAKWIENINFILHIGNGKVEELISYNQLLEHLENAQDHDMGMDQELYRFRAIIGHQGPCLPQIQTGKEANIMFKLNGRLGRLLLNPSPSLLLMIQSHVQHMPKKMTYLLWRDGVDSEALPRRLRSLQEQLSNVRSGKSGDLKPICLGISSPETTSRPCNLTLNTRIANGMMPLSLRWNPC